jgi:hypothetical protein
MLESVRPRVRFPAFRESPETFDPAFLPVTSSNAGSVPVRGPFRVCV